jgi:hypothetical protein
MSEAATAAPAAESGTTAAPETPAAATETQSPAASTPEAQTTTPESPAANAPWFDGFDEDLKGYVQNKGWKDPAAVVDSYRNAEKLLGVPADQVVKLPKADAPPEAWNEVWAKLGRPEDPSGYGLKPAEGADPSFTEWASKTFHELGMPKGMAEQLAAKYDEFGAAMQQQMQEAQQARANEEAAALKLKWGAAHEQNTRLASQAAQNLGIDAETIDALEAGMGFAKTMELFHTLGTKMGESDFVGSGDQGGFGVLSPEQARSKIAELKADKEWTNRYLSGDRAARDEMSKLHRWAYPE